jgi:5,10-methylenetetrahydromethanopterin reductase
MRIGIGIESEKTVDAAIASAQAARDAGFTSAWCSQIFGHDALGLFGIISQAVPGLDLGTAVVPVYSRIPQVMAQQALTAAQAMAPNRLSLGVGLSHQIVVEGLWGQDFSKPASYMTEYLDALMPMVEGRQSEHVGDRITARTFGPLTIQDLPSISVLVAALAPRMLALAGTVATGTITWMSGIATIRDHITPIITQAAESVGKTPEIVVGIPVCVTDDVAAAKDKIDQQFAIYPTLPSYKAMLDKQGAATASDIALMGSHAQILEGLEELEAAGATEVFAAPCGSSHDRGETSAFLGELAKNR